MITQAKVRIFDRYDGDLDMWLRTGKEHEKLLMASADWHLIDLLVQDASVMQRGLGSVEREDQALSRLAESCDSEETIQEIMQLAKRVPK